MGKGKRLSLEEKREGKRRAGKRWGESEVTVGIESIYLHVQQEGIKRKRVAVRNEFMMYSGYKEGRKVTTGGFNCLRLSILLCYIILPCSALSYQN